MTSTGKERKNYTKEMSVSYGLGGV